MKVKELKEYVKTNEPIGGFKVDDDFDLDREIISSSSRNT